MKRLVEHGQRKPLSRTDELPVVEKGFYDFAKGDACDGEVMSPQVGAGITDGDSDERGHQSSDNQAYPWVYMVRYQEKRGGVGSYAEEGHLTEREHTRVAPHDIPGNTHDSKHEENDHHVLVESVGHNKGKNNQEDKCNAGGDELFRWDIPHDLPSQKALRPDPHGYQVDHKDDRILVSGVEKVTPECLDETDEYPGYKGALDAPESAKGDDGKGDETKGASYLRINVVVGRQEGACNPHQGRADTERERVDTVGVDTHEECCLPVHLRREDCLSRPGLLQEKKDGERGKYTSY